MPHDLFNLELMPVGGYLRSCLTALETSALIYKYTLYRVDRRAVEVPQYEEAVLRVFHGSDFVTKLSRILLCESILANMTLVDGYTLGFLIIGKCSRKVEVNEIVDLASSTSVIKELTPLYRDPPVFYVMKRSFGVQRALLEVKAFRSSVVLHDIYGVKHFRVVIGSSVKEALISLVKRYAFEVGERDIWVRLRVKRKVKAPNPLNICRFNGVCKAGMGVSSFSTLTPLEYLALKRAYELGYFDWPKRCSLEQLSRDLGLSKATALEHLRRAVRKLVEEYFSYR